MLTLNDSILPLVPTPLDRPACNYYVDNGDVKILSIAEYLESMPIAIRRLDFKATVIMESGTVSLTDFISFQQTCTVKNYMFVGGVEDDKFIEIPSSSPQIHVGVNPPTDTTKLWLDIN